MNEKLHWQEGDMMGENIKRTSQNELTYIPILLWLNCLWLEYIDDKFQYETKHAQRSLQRCLVVFGFTSWSQMQPSIVATSTWHLKAPILTATSQKWNAWLCLASHEKEKQGAISSHTVGKKILKMEHPSVLATSVQGEGKEYFYLYTKKEEL